MIRKVKFNNFYSFYKDQEISFLSKKKKTYDYYQSESGDQITKIASFIGSNASGKTNVMRLFSFLGYFVCREIDNQPQFVPDFAYKPFFNNDEPSDFSIEFEKDNNIFFYTFSIKKKVILNESLSLKSIDKGSRRVEIFSREEGIVKNLNKTYFKNLSKSNLPKIREDISFITFIKKSLYSVDMINEVYDYFSGFKTNINELGVINDMAHQVRILNIYLTDETIKEEAENFIKHFDIGLSGFVIKKENRDNGFTISVQGIHQNKIKDNKLPFAYESRGTQYLFFVMANILSALKNNNVIIIDEFESGFHPEALNKLISYFIEKNKDKKAQIIFSSHSLGFMNKLDMHQIFLVDKNNNGESLIHRLNKIKNIRPDENFLARYMSGAYGAFPKIRT